MLPPQPSSRCRIVLVSLLAMVIAWVLLLLPRGAMPASPAALPALSERSAAVANGEAGNDQRPGAGQEVQRLETDTAQLPGIAGRLLQDEGPLAGASVRTDDDEPLASTSAADGTFFLPQGRGRTTLLVAGPSVPTGFTFGPIDLADGERFDVGDIHVARPAAVRGRVLDEQGVPLDSVVVYATNGGSDYPSNPEAETDCPSGRTGADGRFRIDGLLPGGAALVVDHPDRIAGSWVCDAKVQLQAGRCFDAGDLVVRAAAPLHGIVRDLDGRPVAGARVVPGGGDCSYLQPRRAVRTGADGAFVLRGFGNGEEVTIEADGYESQLCDDVDLAPRPLIVRLKPALVLEGVVHGAGGKPGYVRLEEKHNEQLTRSVRNLFYRRHPIAADGSFRFVGLPAGHWRLRAIVAGVGDVVGGCDLPQQQPLQLQLQPVCECIVEVVDDDGRAVAGADVRLSNLAEYYDYLMDPSLTVGMEAVTDADGRARFRLRPAPGQKVRAFASGHCSDVHELPADSVPATVTLRLRRGGRICGSVDAAGLRRHAHLRIHFTRVEDRESSGWTGSDSRGSFRTGLLLPGRYELTLVVADAVRPTYEPPVPDPVPVLGDSIRVGSPLLVEVVAGQETKVLLPAPAVAELRGRVLAGGAPVAGALVFAVAGRGEEKPYPLPVEPGLGYGRVSCRADRDGRFAFFAPAGSFELRARHAHGATWSAPVVVEIGRTGASVSRDLALGAAAIRGRFDLAQVALLQRRDVRACLYGLEHAASNPSDGIWTSDGNRTLQYTVQRVELDRSGAFAFECLPPGGWLLRLVDGGGILLQRVVRIRGSEVVELGTLPLPASVEPRLACGLAADRGVQFAQLVDDSELFLRTVLRRDGEPLRWGALAPGRYRLRATAIREVSTSHGHRTWKSLAAGELIGEPIDVEVRADGTCTPASVWPDGLDR